jgi:DNA-binding NarL/FixJ family response regulator
MESPDPVPRLRVVIADDHRHFRFALRAYLESEGIEVVAEAEDGEGALAAVAAERPDVALIDLRMPGRETLAAICATAPATRVIVLSGSERDEDIAATRTAGAAGYIVKGTDGAGVLAAIRMALAEDPA